MGAGIGLGVSKRTEEPLCFLMTLERGTEMLALEAEQPEASEPRVDGGSQFAISPKWDRSSKPALLMSSGVQIPQVWPLSR